MKNFQFLFFLAIMSLITCQFTSCDKECKINPDLISKLSIESVDIIKGEPIDVAYFIESIESASDNCDILKAGSSIGKIAIDYFIDLQDSQGDELFSKENNVNALEAGNEEKIFNRVDVFHNDGIYMVKVIADKTNLVDERDETNNSYAKNIDTRSSSIDVFNNASNQFKQKIKSASALIIIGDKLKQEIQIDYYKGKAIYYANH